MTRVHTTDPGTSGLIRRMSPGAYIPPEPTGLGETLEIFERQLRRSFAAGVEREYVSFPPFQPVAGAYETAVLHLVLRTTGYVGGTPTVKVVFDDSSDANNWATLVTYTEASPADGTYRYQAPTPFGRFLRVRLLISGSGGIGFVLCRGVLSVKRRELKPSTVSLGASSAELAKMVPDTTQLHIPGATHLPAVTRKTTCEPKSLEASCTCNAAER